MRKLESYGNIKDGKLRISYRDRFDEQIARMEDCRVRVTVEKLYKKRSTKAINPETGEESGGQNAYYWGVVVYEFCEGFYEMNQAPISQKEAHEILKAHCNYREIVNHKTGEVKQIAQSTSTLTTVQFEEYLTCCREFVEEWFGRRIPLPNEQVEMELIFTDSK